MPILRLVKFVWAPHLEDDSLRLQLNKWPFTLSKRGLMSAWEFLTTLYKIFRMAFLSNHHEQQVEICLTSLWHFYIVTKTIAMGHGPQS